MPSCPEATFNSVNVECCLVIGKATFQARFIGDIHVNHAYAYAYESCLEATFTRR